MIWVLRLPRAVTVFLWVLLLGLLGQSLRDSNRDDELATKRYLQGNPSRATYGR